LRGLQRELFWIERYGAGDRSGIGVTRVSRTFLACRTDEQLCKDPQQTRRTGR
jgi:hypothetical protein